MDGFLDGAGLRPAPFSIPIPAGLRPLLLFLAQSNELAPSKGFLLRFFPQDSVNFASLWLAFSTLFTGNFYSPRDFNFQRQFGVLHLEHQHR